MERINLKADTTAARFLTVALSLGRKQAARGKLVSDVVLTIDGQEVPFEAALAQMEQEFRQQVEAQAKTMALDMVADAGLMTAVQRLQSARLDIQRALGKIRERCPDDKARVEPTE